MNPSYLPVLDQTRLHEVCTGLGIRMLVLFGSRATGQPAPNADSDVDLALSLTDPGKRCKSWEYHAALAVLLPDAVLDVVSLHDADPLFRWEIMSGAVLLWGDPDEFLELRAYAYRDFVDSADLRALERTLSERKLARIRRQLHAAS